MKAAKAVRRLRSFLRWRKPDPDDNFVEAVQLGYEALRLLAMEPPEGYSCIPRPLPGETKE